MDDLTCRTRSRVSVSFRLEAPWYDRIQRLASLKGVTVEEYTQEALEMAVRSDESFYGGEDEYPLPLPVHSSPFLC